MKRKVIFIDDEPSQVKAHRDGLEANGWDVEMVERVDDYWYLLHVEKKLAHLVIVDILMPEGKKYRSSSGLNDDTGIAIVKDILAVQASSIHPVPIAVLTQLDTRQVDEAINDAIKQLLVHTTPIAPWKLWSKAVAAQHFAREVTQWHHNHYLGNGLEVLEHIWSELEVADKWDLLEHAASLRNRNR